MVTKSGIYGDGFVKPGCRFKSMKQKSARLSPSPSASVDLPHLSRRPAGVCAFCRISLEPEAEGDSPTTSVGSSEGRRARERSSIYSGSSAHANVARKNKSEGCRHSFTTTIHDGVVVLPLYGVILLSRHVHRHSDSTNLRSSPIRHKLSQLKHFAGNHLAGTRAGMLAGSPPSRR